MKFYAVHCRNLSSSVDWFYLAISESESVADLVGKNDRVYEVSERDFKGDSEGWPKDFRHVYSEACGIWAN